uniref:hypothetical protein n=1 Tax=Helicobacter rodentium TaxID=59617 RepID=UPI002628AAF7
VTLRPLLSVFVVWYTLLNLGATAEDSAQMFDNKKMKELLDMSYLESLDEVAREQFLKSELLLKNILESV